MHYSLFAALGGFIFAPITTIVYAWIVVQSRVYGHHVEGLSLIWVALALFVDLSVWVGSFRLIRRGMIGVGGKYFAGLLVGASLGGILGFVLRPSAGLFGRLPFDVVITAGSNLRGADELLKPLAQQSFEYLVAGIVVGGVLGLVLAMALNRGARVRHG